ncbi:hypothetical protein ACJX0J_031780, partial [Zea mays]
MVELIFAVNIEVIFSFFVYYGSRWIEGKFCLLVPRQEYFLLSPLKDDIFILYVGILNSGCNKMFYILVCGFLINRSVKFCGIHVLYIQIHNLYSFDNFVLVSFLKYIVIFCNFDFKPEALFICLCDAYEKYIISGIDVCLKRANIPRHGHFHRNMTAGETSRLSQGCVPLPLTPITIFAGSNLSGPSKVGSAAAAQ